MTIGNKIKQARISQKLTQSDICDGIVTRNMISAIESGKATPSLETARLLAQRLDLPLSYLLSEDDDLFFFRKKERIKAIKSALEAKNYNACISLILKLEQLDDELNFILCTCYFELGITLAKNGSLKSALKYFNLCRVYSARTLYDTSRIETTIPLYEAICNNVNSPLLEFEEDKFIPAFRSLIDFEFYRYLVLDYDYKYENFVLKGHIKAKQLIKDRKYSEAISVLHEIESRRGEQEYNAYVLYGIYGDLELCYKKLFDFENAYRYSSKRLSLTEGFNS